MDSPQTSSTTSQAPSPPILLTWQDLSYSVTVKDTTADSWQRTLLRGITGYVRSGDMLAILGPSGAGKTTLLDVLAHRKTTGCVGGKILLNGEPVDHATLRRVSGYVQQEDVMYSYVTVEETIRCAATLRTPPSVTAAEIDVRVDRVQQLLGIDHVRHRQIGSAFRRGISGGEKKRCAVAMELVTSPSLLFLDEPTTGLDTFTALHLLHILKAFARRGVAIIFSIHQPRSSIFSLFDKVLLLNGVGEQAYFGPANEAVPFLLEVGITPVYPANPADFLLDTVSVIEADDEALLSYVTDGSSDMGGGGGAFTIPPATQGLDVSSAYRAMKLPFLEVEMERLLAEVSALYGDLPVSEGSGEGGSSSPYLRGVWTQISVVSRRAFLNKMRDPIATVASISVAMVFAVLIGSMYYEVGRSQDSIRNRMGVLFFLMMNTTFSSLSSLGMFLTDRGIYVREHRKGMYSAAAFYAGKIIQDVPIGLLVNFLFNVIVYLMVGLQRSIVKFIIFDVVCSLVMLNSYAMCLFMSNLAKDYAVANILASLVLVLFLLPTSGMLISISSIPFVWRWLKHVSFVRYAFAALVMNEFDGLELTCSPAEAAVAPCITSGTAFAQSQGFFMSDLWLYVGLISASVCVYLALGYITLRFWRSVENN